MHVLPQLHGLGFAESCATLPSSTAAADFLDGKPGGLASVVTSTALRAGLIAVGLLVVGQRKGVVKGAIGGAIAIEAFVLTYIAANRKTP